MNKKLIIIIKNFTSYLFAIFIFFCAINQVLNISKIKIVYGDEVEGWGVLAVNTDKDIYYPNENIHIEYAVLDHNGLMACDSLLELVISDARNNIIQKLSTVNGGIIVSTSCRQKENKMPDFESNTALDKYGEYKLTLTADTKSGTYSIRKNILVSDHPAFDVKKITSTRIYPKDKYEVRLQITAHRNFIGSVEEIVPSVFIISDTSLFKVEKFDNDKNKLVWDVNWKKNHNYELIYRYKAPEISPEFFELGPTNIISSKLLDKLLKKDQISVLSSWQVAVDALVARYAASCSGGWDGLTLAQGAPNLASNAVYSSFTTSNSASDLVSNRQTLECTTFNSFDLGQFVSANIVFSFATDGGATYDDYITISYDVGASNYVLTTIVQNSQKSNATNGGYWTYPATNLTSFANLNSLTINFVNSRNVKADTRRAYVDAVWVDITYNARTYTQNDFEWFVTANSVTLTNAWPTGIGENLTENQILAQIPASNEPMDTNGRSKIRIQMNFIVGAYDLPASGNNYKLQYSAANDCTTALSWTDVGAKGSASIWRLFDETSLSDSTAQINDISTSNSGAEGYYSEINATGNNPNAVTATYDTEWDWPVENNGAVENTTYCFRMVLNDSTLSFSYNADSYPKLTTTPGASNLLKHGNIFQNDEEKGYFWAN